MINEPTAEQLAKIPAIGSTEGIEFPEKLIHLEFRLFNMFWLICEYDPIEQMFFGYANLGDDLCAEWGYIPFRELKSLGTGGFCRTYNLHDITCKVYDPPKLFKEFMPGSKAGIISPSSGSSK